MRSKFVILCMMTVVPTNSVAHLTTLSPSKCCRYKVREPLTETYVAISCFFYSVIMMIMVVRIVIMVMNDVENADAAAADDDDDNDTAKCRTELKVSTCQAR